MFDMRIKSLFFDRAKVEQAVDAAKRKVLSRFGAYVRQRAISSIRKRRGISAPGSPPHSHTGLIKRFIFFGYDPAKDSVVIGPLKLHKGGRTLELLEEGGQVRLRKTRMTVIRGNRGRDKRGRFTKAELVELKAGQVLKYKPRPFMGPALQQEQSKLPALWQDSVK